MSEEIMGENRGDFWKRCYESAAAERDELKQKLSQYVGDESARLLLDQVRREWYRFTGYSQLKADIDHYLDSSRISPRSTT